MHYPGKPFLGQLASLDRPLNMGTETPTCRLTLVRYGMSALIVGEAAHTACQSKLLRVTSPSEASRTTSRKETNQ